MSALTELVEVGKQIGGKRGEATGWGFGLERQVLIAKLRAFADDIQSGNAIVRDVALLQTAKVEDFEETTLTIRFNAKRIFDGSAA